YHAFAGGSWDAALKHFDGSGYGALKTGVAEAVIAGLEPIQHRFRDIRDDEAGLVGFLTRSAEAAAERAEATMQGGRKAGGIVWATMAMASGLPLRSTSSSVCNS